VTVSLGSGPTSSGSTGKPKHKKKGKH
jgi:hypothetical protein